MKRRRPVQSIRRSDVPSNEAAVKRKQEKKANRDRGTGCMMDGRYSAVTIKRVFVICVGVL